jgi:soluble lytic murein transglycosylase-like protein
MNQGMVCMAWFLRGCVALTLLCACAAHAGYQKEEDLADSVRTLLRQSVFAQIPQQRPFTSERDQQNFYRWRSMMSERMANHLAQPSLRVAILDAVDYEARRAGLEPALVLGVITVESRFQPTATSPVGARGLMQVMPFWARSIGDGNMQRLYHIRMNIRFGCVILRHYLDKERGDLVRALARYNGSLGQTTYAQKVLMAARQWR